MNITAHIAAARTHFQQTTRALAAVGTLKSCAASNRAMLSAASTIGLRGFINPRLTRGQLFVRFTRKVRGYFPVAPDGSIGAFVPVG